MATDKNMTTDKISLRALLRGVAKGIPTTGTFNRGLLNLALAKPDRKHSIGMVLEAHARRRPGHTALRFQDKQWSYRDFNAWANRYAALLRAQGIRRGDVVGILIENHPQALACVAATVKMGAIAGMLNHNQQGHVLFHSIRLIKPKFLIAGSSCVDALTPLLPKIGLEVNPKLFWVATEERAHCPEPYLDLEKLAARFPETNPPETAEIPLRSPCFYIFTSGTTGMPKASVMTHYRWVRGMAGVSLMALRLKESDVFYCALPLYHNNALTVSWGSALGAGATLALSRKFSATRFWDEIRHHHATAFCYIGEVCRYLLNQPPTPQDRKHDVRVIVGNGLRPEIWDAFKERFGIEHIAEFYAASESNLAFINGFGLDRTAGFCPLPFAIVEFDLEHEQPKRDAKGHLIKVQSGGVGLLISEVTDKAPFDGYTDPEATEKKLLRNSFVGGDCWVNTGDLVRDQGFRHIQFVDRVGDTFRWKGENVATTEIEGVLGDFPQVEQAVVYGVQLPGTDGRAGMATLLLRNHGEDLDGPGLAGHALKELPAYAVPLFVRVAERLDTTGTFKVRKVDLKSQAFDPDRVQDPLYVLLDRARGYERLTQDIYQRISGGEHRF